MDPPGCKRLFTFLPGVVMSVVDVVGELSPPGIKNKVYSKAKCDKAQVVFNFFFEGGGGGGGRGVWTWGPNLPTPILSSLASSHTPFQLRDIKHGWVISPYFSPCPFRTSTSRSFLYLLRYPFRPFSSGLNKPLSSYTFWQNYKHSVKKKNDKERGISSIIPFKSK